MENLMTYKEFLDAPRKSAKVLDLGCGDAVHLFDAQRTLFGGYSKKGRFLGVDKEAIQSPYYTNYSIFTRSVSTAQMKTSPYWATMISMMYSSSWRWICKNSTSFPRNGI